MNSEDGELFVKQLAGFVRTHEKALANAAQFQRRTARHRPTQSTNSVAAVPSSPSIPERPATSASSVTTPLATTFSLGSLGLASSSVKSARLALTPHHLFYLLSRFEELGIAVGPMKIRLENLHSSSASANYVSFLGNTPRPKDPDAVSISSVSSVRSVMSSMSALFASFGIGASISAARTERQQAAAQADLKYLYSAFTKIPCLRLAPDWRARLIRGYEEFPFDSAVPLYAFKNLQALEVSGIDFRQFFGWDRLAEQLRSLTLKHAGIDDPADILIDIVLDDMDKRRRRTSKSQSSPATSWGFNGSSRRGSVVPELQRSHTVPTWTDPRPTTHELGVVGSLTSEHAIDDGSNSDTAKPQGQQCHGSDDPAVPKSPVKAPTRPRSNSPSRLTGSRKNSHQHTRSSQRTQRSGSGSSHSSLSDSWHHHARSSSSTNLLSIDILPASKWRFLRHLSLADNSMTSISSTSLAPLSNSLYSLDLSSNLFAEIPDSLASLTALRALNLSQCMIDSLHSLTRSPLPAITALNLRANRLQSLAGVEKLYPLERLDLRDNRLTDPSELARLTGIPDIREIWVEGNPFARTHKDYRVTIFNLFRKTPGYTEDIIIDGTGPSYSERRSLVERAPIPDSVPVVKPKAPEVPTVDMSKPTIVYGSPKDAAVVRRERPTPKAVLSEVHTGSTRRRKAPKRRIIDLATGGDVPAVPPLNIHVRNDAAATSPVDRSDSATPEENNYRISHVPQTQQLQPSVILTDTRKGNVPRAAETSGDAATTATGRSENVENTTSPTSPKWKVPDNWHADAENYRLKIETLRDKVGDGYLSALGDQAWASNPSPPTTVTAPTLPTGGAVGGAAIRPVTRNADSAQSIQTIHDGRTLGQPLPS
ncbi:Leucine Rich Repeat [Geosmithia morbida]|uniref:Leucine Rich Repeat n=1 Tax=Geosmithia morbida TaxID=1094350 RepID=A0A9P5D2W3_9HYPO|nr:Leucine Rich Repeat [Geosmithia morbida]KAF4121205.1 Leucine Rich Repeat [Geosmithia morbida]